MHLWCFSKTFMSHSHTHSQFYHCEVFVALQQGMMCIETQEWMGLRMSHVQNWDNPRNSCYVMVENQIQIKSLAPQLLLAFIVMLEVIQQV